MLVPHISSNSSHASELKLKRTYYDDQYERFTLVFHHVGSWDEMEKLLVEQFIGEQQYLEAATLKLASIHNLATAYTKQGRWDEAEKLEMKVMNAR